MNGLELNRKLVALLLASLALAGCECSLMFKLKYQPFAQLNKYLAARLGSDHSPAANIEAANEYLQQLKGSGNFIPGFMIVLRQFSSLRSLLLPSRIEDRQSIDLSVFCSREACKLLKKLTDIVEDNSGPDRRVDRIILQVALEHALHCLPKYARLFAAKKAEIGSQDFSHKLMFDRVAGVLTPIINSHLARLESQDAEASEAAGGDLKNWKLVVNLFKRWVLEESPLEADVDASQLYDLLTLKVDGNPLIFKKCKNCLKEMRVTLQRRLVAPCRSFVASFGPDLFEPAHFDMLFLSARKLHYPQGEIDETVIDFYYNWARFRICESLIDRSSDGVKREKELSRALLMVAASKRELTTTSAPSGIANLEEIARLKPNSLAAALREPKRK